MWRSQIGKDEVCIGTHQSFVGFRQRWEVLFLGGVHRFLQSGLGSVEAVVEAPEVVPEEAIPQVVSKFIAELMLSLL